MHSVGVSHLESLNTFLQGMRSLSVLTVYLLRVGFKLTAKSGSLGACTRTKERPLTLDHNRLWMAHGYHSDNRSRTVVSSEA